MPTYPTSPLVDFVAKAFAAVAPSQAQYFASRVQAWRNASSITSGATALAGTLGQRLSQGGITTDALARYLPPRGQARYQ